MREIGLIPTDTGETGGKETGQKMTHLIDDNGRFAKSAAKLMRVHHEETERGGDSRHPYYRLDIARPGRLSGELQKTGKQAISPIPGLGDYKTDLEKAIL